MLTNMLYPANRHLGGVSALPGTASCQPATARSLPLPTTLPAGCFVYVTVSNPNLSLTQPIRIRPLTNQPMNGERLQDAGPMENGKWH